MLKYEKDGRVYYIPGVDVTEAYNDGYAAGETKGKEAACAAKHYVKTFKVGEGINTDESKLVIDGLTFHPEFVTIQCLDMDEVHGTSEECEGAVVAVTMDLTRANTQISGVVYVNHINEGGKSEGAYRQCANDKFSWDGEDRAEISGLTYVRYTYLNPQVDVNADGKNDRSIIATSYPAAHFMNGLRYRVVCGKEVSADETA